MPTDETEKTSTEPFVRTLIDVELYPTYELASANQLTEWLLGKPKHNPFAPGCTTVEESQGGECCPDFSCCVPSMLRGYPERHAFVVASDSGRENMCLRFLGDMLESSGYEVKT